MQFWIGITDGDWYGHLSRKQPEEVNFWQPGATPPRNMPPGTLRRRPGGRTTGLPAKGLPSLAEDLISESRAAELMGIPVVEFRSIRNVDYGKQAVDQ